MILTVLGIALISLILIIVCHSVWSYFYDMWISPHISSSPPAISPYIISVNEPVFSSIFGFGSDTSSGSDSAQMKDSINIAGTSNIAELQIDLSAEYGGVPQGIGMGGSAMMSNTIPVSNLPPPEMEVSKRNLKELFSNLKKEGTSGGGGGGIGTGVGSIGGRRGEGTIGDIHTIDGMSGLSGSSAFMNASPL